MLSTGYSANLLSIHIHTQCIFHGIEYLILTRAVKNRLKRVDPSTFSRDSEWGVKSKKQNEKLEKTVKQLRLPSQIRSIRVYLLSFSLCPLPYPFLIKTSLSSFSYLLSLSAFLPFLLIPSPISACKRNRSHSSASQHTERERERNNIENAKALVADHRRRGPCA